jgi:hypothetical protein
MSARHILSHQGQQPGHRHRPHMRRAAVEADGEPNALESRDLPREAASDGFSSAFPKVRP